jgi:hypothetical protein
VQRDAADVNTFGKYVAGIAGSVLAGTALFVLSFVAVDCVWTYLVVTDPKQINMGDGVVVVGGGVSNRVQLSESPRWFLSFIDFGLGGHQSSG